MSEFTNAELAAEAKREAGMRRRVYGRWVEEGRKDWTPERADRGVRAMLAISDHFDALAKAEAEAIAPRLDL